MTGQAASMTGQAAGLTGQAGGMTGQARQVPASAGQRLLWFLDRYRGQSGALNCPMVCRIRGQADEAALRQAITLLAARHESLRTTFSGSGRRLVQLIHQPAPVPVAEADLRGAGDPRAALDAALYAELRTPVDARAAAVRAALWRVADTEWVLALTLHHMVTDTWSCGILFEDLAACYGQAATGDGPGLGPAGWQFAQFAAWQQRQLRSPAFGRHREYWQQQLAGIKPPPLPIGGASSAAGAERASAHGFVPAATGAALRELAQAERTTAFTVLLAVYQALLHQRTGVDDVAVATLFTNRVRPELQRTTGFLANMVVLRTVLPEPVTFTALVRRTRQTVIEAFAHQELPYHLLAQGGERGGPLRADDIVFQMLAEPLDRTVTAGGVRFEEMVPDVPGRFDFELALMPQADGYAAKLYYTADRVDRDWAEDFTAGYAAVAEAVARAPERPLDTILGSVPSPAAR